ncbi:MAG: 3D domain-containing protein [Phycisphaerales bacterium]|nr:3D domain-containing protein [Phycisphaerales bacterium]
MLSTAFWARGLCAATLAFSVSTGLPTNATPTPTDVRKPLMAIRSSATQSMNAATGSRETLVRIYRVTAYCDRGTTAAGVPSGVGQCAAPADIPFGSEIYIPELDRTFIVTDRTAQRFRHNTVDLFMPAEDQCLKFGRNYLECEIRLPENPVRYGSPRLLAQIASVL